MLANVFQTVAPAKPVYAADECIMYKRICPANTPFDIRKRFNIQTFCYGSIIQGDMLIKIGFILVVVSDHGLPELNLEKNQYPPKGP